LSPPENKTPDGGARDGSAQQSPPHSLGTRPAIPVDLAGAVAKVNWKTDLSGGIQRVAIRHGLAPFGNGKARCVVWNYPDPVPKHREPLYTARRDLLPKYATHADRRLWRLPQLYASIQANDVSAKFPLVLTSGRLVEYEGGGDETRANVWLAELQQRMFAEINPADAQKAGVRDGETIWVATPEGARVRVTALVTKRVDPGTVFMPFHFAGWWMGRDISGRYPEGTVPYVVGESANTATTYGYDPVTAMQETKTTLCRIEAA
jgi:formate dehydrogenase major subunit